MGLFSSFFSSYPKISTAVPEVGRAGSRATTSVEAAASARLPAEVAGATASEAR